MTADRILAISDIHGDLDKFAALLEKIEYNPEADQLILLGDYIDRGPNPRGVLNKIMDLQEEGAIVLRGNHDDMLVGTVTGEPGAWQTWMMNGGRETLQSYDASSSARELPDTSEFHRHVSFLKQLDYYYETQTHIFVHAGVNPDIPLEKNDPYDLVWIREAFYTGYKGDKTVIFGHTPTPMLHNDSNRFDVYFGSNNIIGIDGGAVYGGQLNCLEIPGNTVFSVD